MKKSFVFLFALIVSTISQAQPDMPPTIVETAKVTQSVQKPSIESVGTFKAEHGIVVRPEIPGRITELHFKSGQFVKKGSLLVSLNPVIVKAQLETFKTRLTLSEKTAKRYQELMKTQVISKEEFDKVQAALAQDKAQLAEAKARLAQTQITAAFSGKVGLRQVSVGDYVQAGQALVNLESQDPILVEFTVPANQISSVKPGLEIVVSSDAFPDQIFNGKVTATEARVDAATRSLTVHAEVANPNHILIPGVFASVKLDLGQANTVVTIPQAAVLYQAGQAFVYRYADHKAVKTDVTLGLKSANQVTVVTGLKTNDEIIVAGQHKIMPGAPVMKLGETPPQAQP